MGQSTEELSTQIADTRENLASDLDALQDKVSPGAVIARRRAAVRTRMSSVRSKVMGSGQHAAGSASSAAGTVRGAASSATDKAPGMADTLEQRVEGSPLAAGLAAFGAGMVIAGLIPASETEAKAARRVQQTAQEHGQPVLDEAKAAARDVGEQLKESGAQAASEVRAAAQESASRVKDETSTGGDRGSSPSGAPSTAG